MAARAFIAVVMRLSRSCYGDGHAAIRGVVAACDADSSGFVAIDTDFFNVVVDDPFKQAVSGGGVRPSVFVGAGDDQSDAFSRGLELLIMVCASPAAILDMKHAVIVHMAHFMQERPNGVFNLPVERTRPNVDFVLLFFAVDRPDFANAVMAVGAGRTLNGDDRRFELSGEQVFIEHSEQFFKLSGEARGLCYFFHGGAPFYFLLDGEGVDRL